MLLKIGEILKNIRRNTVIAFVITFFSVITNTSAAFAHASVQDANAVANGYGSFSIRIPHGCEAKATDSVVFVIPSDVTGVKPERKAGWSTQIEKSENNPTTVTYIAEVGLPDDQFEDFGFSVKWPDKPNQIIYFEVTQNCGDKQTIWNEIPKEGEDSHSLDHPAPSVTLSAAESNGHGATHSDEMAKEVSSTVVEENNLLPIIYAVIAGLVAGVVSSYLFTRKR